jgi:hypothetical protein
VDTADGAGAREWVLKVHNPADSLAQGQPGGALDAQNALMLYAAARAAAAGLTCNRPVARADGSGCVAAAELRGRRHAVRLLEFLPGRVLGLQAQVCRARAPGHQAAFSARGGPPLLSPQAPCCAAIAAAPTACGLPRLQCTAVHLCSALCFNTPVNSDPTRNILSFGLQSPQLQREIGATAARLVHALRGEWGRRRRAYSPNSLHPGRVRCPPAPAAWWAHPARPQGLTTPRCTAWHTPGPWSASPQRCAISCPRSPRSSHGSGARAQRVGTPRCMSCAQRARAPPSLAQGSTRPSPAPSGVAGPFLRGGLGSQLTLAHARPLPGTWWRVLWRASRRRWRVLGVPTCCLARSATPTSTSRTYSATRAGPRSAPRRRGKQLRAGTTPPAAARPSTLPASPPHPALARPPCL